MIRKVEAAGPGKDLLLGDRALGPAAGEECDGPAGERGHTILEAGQERQVYDEPQQPGDGPSDPDRTQPGYGPEAAIVAIVPRSR